MRWAQRLVPAFVLFSFGSGIVTANYSTGPFVETQTIVPVEPSPVEDLGFSMAAANGLLIAGAINSQRATGEDVGSAYIYRRSATGVWNHVAQLFAHDGEHNAAFGSSVAFDGIHAIIGSNASNEETNSRGAAYIFERINDDDWQQAGRFDSSVSTTYSYSVDLDGPHAVVAGRQRINLTTTRGFVDVLQRAAPGSWERTQQISFGGFDSHVHNVALDDKTLAVGGFRRPLPNSDTEYVVEVYNQIGGEFRHTTTLRPSTGSQAINFGLSLALDGDRLVVGAPQEMSETGAAYFF